MKSGRGRRQQRDISGVVSRVEGGREREHS